MKLCIGELDCIFISYDEANAENNWADLRDKCMWADRVHGVKGSDECHKAAAELSNTEWFVSVDADNIVDPAFFEIEVGIPDDALAVSWPAVNGINGLRYGNGSLKAWRKDFVLNMKTHEAADNDTGAVDFCWESGYIPMLDSYSVTYPNSSPYHAWRAGFREGVKMSLNNGVLPENPDVKKLHWHQTHRLSIWTSIGAHAEYGLWSILGARHGAYKTNCTDWDYVSVRDFEVLKEIWNEVKNEDALSEIEKYGTLLKKEFNFDTELLPAGTSKFVVETFKDLFIQSREQVMWTLRQNRVIT